MSFSRQLDVGKWSLDAVGACNGALALILGAVLEHDWRGAWSRENVWSWESWDGHAIGNGHGKRWKSARYSIEYSSIDTDKSLDFGPFRYGFADLLGPVETFSRVRVSVLHLQEPFLQEMRAQKVKYLPANSVWVRTDLLQGRVMSGCQNRWHRVQVGKEARASWRRR